MTENKTVANDADVDAFLRNTTTEDRLPDANTIIRLMRTATGCEAKMWGTGIIGFGTYHYKYESGREGDFILTGFAPRKREFAIYIIPGFSQYEELLAKLGKHRHGKSCLYVKQLADVDMDVLEELISASVRQMKDKYGESSQ